MFWTGGSETEYNEHNGTLFYDDEDHNNNGTDVEHDENSVFDNLVRNTYLTSRTLVRSYNAVSIMYYYTFKTPTIES